MNIPTADRIRHILNQINCPIGTPLAMIQGVIDQLRAGGVPLNNPDLVFVEQFYLHNPANQLFVARRAHQLQNNRAVRGIPNNQNPFNVLANIQPVRPPLNHRVNVPQAVQQALVPPPVPAALPQGRVAQAAQAPARVAPGAVAQAIAPPAAPQGAAAQNQPPPAAQLNAPPMDQVINTVVPANDVCSICVNPLAQREHAIMFCCSRPGNNRIICRPCLQNIHAGNQRRTCPFCNNPHVIRIILNMFLLQPVVPQAPPLIPLAPVRPPLIRIPFRQMASGVSSAARSVMNMFRGNDNNNVNLPNPNAPQQRPVAVDPLQHLVFNDNNPEIGVVMRRNPGNGHLSNYERRLHDVRTVTRNAVQLRNETWRDWVLFRIPNFIRDEYETLQYTYEIQFPVVLPHGLIEDLGGRMWAARYGGDDRQNLNVVTEYCKNQLDTVNNMTPYEISVAIHYAPLIAYHQYYKMSVNTNSEARFQYYKRIKDILYRRFMYIVQPFMRYGWPFIKWIIFPILAPIIKKLLVFILRKVSSLYFRAWGGPSMVEFVVDNIDVTRVIHTVPEPFSSHTTATLSTNDAFQSFTTVPQLMFNTWTKLLPAFYGGSVTIYDQTNPNDPPKQLGPHDIFIMTIRNMVAVAVESPYAIFGAPIVEELFVKRFFNFMTGQFHNSIIGHISLLVLESMQYQPLIHQNYSGLMNGTQAFLVYFGWQGIVHNILYQLKPTTAVIAHSLFNLLGSATIFHISAIMYFTKFMITKHDFDVPNVLQHVENLTTRNPDYINGKVFEQYIPNTEAKIKVFLAGLTILFKYWWPRSHDKKIPTFLLENADEIPFQQRPGSSIRLPIEQQFKEIVKPSQYLYGIGSLYKPLAYQSNLHNEIAAVKARVVTATPVPNPFILQDCINFTRNNLHHILPRCYRTVVKPMPIDEYLQITNASEPVKKRIKQTRMKLESMGINEYTVLTPDQVYKMTTRGGFVKVENLILRSLGNTKKKKAPRLINSSTPEFIALCAPWFASLRRILKRDLNINNFLIYSSGISAKKLATRLMRAKGTFIENDVDTWDASLHEKFAEFEIDMCKHFGIPIAVYQLCKENVRTHGYTFHGVKYKVKGTRKSGDPFTSDFNSFWNLVIHCYIICRANNWTYLQAMDHIVMAAAGDDNVMKLDAPVIPNFVLRLRELGFSSKAIIRRNWYEVEFCSNRIYETSDGNYMFGPKPGKVLAKNGYFIQPPSLKKVSRESLVRGTALGLLPACNHIPILKSYIVHLLNITEGHEAVYGRQEEWKMLYSKSEAGLGTWQNLAHHYGWSKSSQDMFDKSISKVGLGQVASFPLFNYVCDYDTSGPKFYH